ncbi:hypothetical protein [Tardiphaga sp. 813_E8_N1_3]|uniref:hypothetical protein n=1 Tax=Tardiphaga sp. 813_E8_N1_3 TaxID=3240760 RepID=UPI003F243746
MVPSDVDAAVIAANSRDVIEQNCGSNDVLGHEFWEVWVKDQFGQMATRFVEVEGDKVVRVYPVFEQLVFRLNTLHGEAQLRREIAKREHELKRITVLGSLICAFGGFAATLGMFIYLTVQGGENAFWPSIIMAASVVVTCGTYLFGKFVMVDPAALGGIPNRCTAGVTPV